MIDLSRRIADIVSDHPETARILQRHRIDFCCKGERPLRTACAERGLDAEAVGAELETAIAERRAGQSDDPRELSTPELVDRIVSRHHAYLRRALPFLVPLAAKVARVHGDHDPRLVPLFDVVRSLSDALLPHLDHEEAVLFPSILAGAGSAETREELRSMQTEHLEVGGLLERMRNLTDDFAMPDWACRSYKTLFAELEDLEGDVLAHVHLENHVLAPRAVAGAAE